MAIYHCRAKIIQRSKGQSAVKSAAYRHGVRLFDERLNRAFRYRKSDVVHSAILAPEGAAEWVFKRHELWNRVEAAETRVNAQPAREIEVTIPRELGPEARIELVHNFVRDAFVSRGMVADIAIHVPEDAQGRPQPHAHIMLTKRRLDPDRPSGFARTKARDWDEDPNVELALRDAKATYRKDETPEHAAQVEAIDRQRNIFVWRRAWEQHANRALAEAQKPARIDHRTLEAQGIKREAQPHLGLARHIENAYGAMKSRVAGWISVLKRNELYRAFEPYKRRDQAKFARDVSTIQAITDGVLDHWRQRPREPQRVVAEVGHDPGL